MLSFIARAAIRRPLYGCTKYFSSDNSACWCEECCDPVENAREVYESCCLPADLEECQPSVVIIGAGMAGLSAAQRLHHCGFTKIKVLEAKEQPGGRMRSCKFGDTTVELGCPWISGASIANPAYTLAASGGYLPFPLPRVKNTSGIFFTSEGRAISQSHFVRAAKLVQSIVHQAGEVYYTQGNFKCKSLSGFFNEKFLKALDGIPEVDRYDTTRIVYSLFNDLRIRLGDDLKAVSLKFFGTFKKIPGGNVAIPQGLQMILNTLVDGLPKGTVLCSKPVKCIRWGASECGCPRALVICEDGSQFKADYVIVTVSLGVLKNLSEKLFCPALPSLKTDALKNMGFGNSNRIFVAYDNPFWLGHGKGIHLAWSPEELSTKDSWIKGVSKFVPVPHSSKVLVADVAGPEAKAVEHTQDKDVIEDITYILRRFLGDRCLPWPTAVTRSEWTLDKHFFGSFSYMGLASKVKDICDLAEPLPRISCDDVPPILLFAGEHTHPTQYGTLQGARRSGIREASRVFVLTMRYANRKHPIGIYKRCIECPMSTKEDCPPKYKKATCI